MQVGRLDRKISFEYPVSAVEPLSGTPLISWQRLCTCAAEIQDVMPSRSELVRQNLDMARNQSRVRVRYRDGITSDMRIVVHGDGDQVYQIVGGPAAIGGRKSMIEVVVEKYSS